MHDRRAIYADAILRFQKDESHPEQEWSSGQQEACAEIDEANGSGGDLSEASSEQAWCESSDLSVSASRTDPNATGSGLGGRHHVHPASTRLALPGGRHGLVQPVCPLLGDIHYLGNGLLSYRAGEGFSVQFSRNLQYRPGVSVYQRFLHGHAQRKGGQHQHGRSGPGDGQHLYRKVMAFSQV